MKIYNNKIKNALLEANEFIQESNKQRLAENKLIDDMVINYINSLDHNSYDYISFKKAYEDNNITVIIRH